MQPLTITLRQAGYFRVGWEKLGTLVADNRLEPKWKRGLTRIYHWQPIFLYKYFGALVISHPSTQLSCLQLTITIAGLVFG